MSNVIQVATGKPSVDAAGELADAIRCVVDQLGDGLSIALIIGAIEIAKWEIMRDAEQ